LTLYHANAKMATIVTAAPMVPPTMPLTGMVLNEEANVGLYDNINS
jgi:hypothetical protein